MAQDNSRRGKQNNLMDGDIDSATLPHFGARKDDTIPSSGNSHEQGTSDGHVRSYSSDNRGSLTGEKQLSDTGVAQQSEQAAEEKSEIVLKGRTSEDIAGKHSDARAETAEGRWQSTDESTKMIHSHAGQQEAGGIKHAVTDAESKIYHEVKEDEEDRNWEARSSDGSDFRGLVTDDLGRSQSGSEGLKKITEERGEDFGRLDLQNKTEKSSMQARDVHKTHFKGDGTAFGEATKELITSQYQSSDAVQGKNEVKKDAKAVATLTGMSAMAHAAVRSNISAGMNKKKHVIGAVNAIEDKATVTSADEREHVLDSVTSHVFYGRKDRDLADGISRVESATGHKYVTGADNSFGNATKDISNNMGMIKKYFKDQGINLEGMSSVDLDMMIKTGKMYNKVTGRKEMIKSWDLALLKEYKGLVSKQKAMQRAGTWREDLADTMSSLYGDADAAQGMKVAKVTAKSARAAIKFGKGVTYGGISAGIAVLNAPGKIINDVARAGVNIGGGAAGVFSKRARKWRAEKNATLRMNRAKWSAREASQKRAVRKAVMSPVRTAGQGLWKLTKFIGSKTIGRTRMGKAVAQGFAKMSGRAALIRQAIQKRINKIKNNIVTKVITAPSRIFGGVIRITRKVALYVCCVLFLITIACGFIIAGPTMIGSLLPYAGTNSVTDETDGGGVWNDAKGAIQDKIIDISEDSTSWAQKEHKAMVKKAYGIKLHYAENFIFAGINFNGPSNLVTEREHSENAQSLGLSGSSTNPADVRTVTVPDGAADTNKKSYKKYLSGHNNNLTAKKGTVQGPNGKETYYHMDFKNLEHTLELHCKFDPKCEMYKRSDGVMMWGVKGGESYVMCAANLSVPGRSRGSKLMTSLGPAIVIDTGTFASSNPGQLDICVSWGDQAGKAASGTVDVWGAGSNTGGDLVSTSNDAGSGGKVANAENYLRGIIGMATVATGNENEVSHTQFYSDYCSHIVDNSYRYSQYCAARKWADMIATDTDVPTIIYNASFTYFGPDPTTDADFGLSSEDVNRTMTNVFDVAEIDREYKYKNNSDGSTTKTLKSITYSLSLNFMNCGLWGATGEDDFKDQDDSGTRESAGLASSPDTSMTNVGMFDVEDKVYSFQAPAGDTVSTTPGDDDYLHLIGAGLKEDATGDDDDDYKSSEYQVEADPIEGKDTAGYNEWEGWADDGYDDTDDRYIYQSGSNTSYAEMIYDLSTDDLLELGFNLNGIYNVNNLGEDGGSGGNAAASVSESEIQSILSNVDSELEGSSASKKAKQQRKNAVEAALRLIGKATYNMNGPGPNMHGVTYTSGRGKNNLTNFSEWKSQSDCSGYVSYVLYKSGASKFTNSQALDTSGLKSGGKEISNPSESTLLPGDVIVKRNGTSKEHYDNHVVMYIGKTSLGNFTIVECTSRSGISGPQMRGYKSLQDFWNSRGTAYKYFRNYYG